jgi:hypothetical protein
MSTAGKRKAALLIVAGVPQSVVCKLLQQKYLRPCTTFTEIFCTEASRNSRTPQSWSGLDGINIENSYQQVLRLA